MSRTTGVRWRVNAGSPEQSPVFESAVLRSAPVAMLVIDTARDRLVFANHRAEALLGSSREALAELGLSGRVAWEADERGQPAPGALRAALTSAAAGHEARCELGLGVGRGPARRARARFEPTFGAGQFVSVVLEEASPAAPPEPEDGPERHVAQARRKRLASVGMLAAGVAHEINNPLAYILNNLDFALHRLARGAGPAPEPEALEALQEAREGALRVREVVKDLRIFARAGASEQLLDVREVVEASLNLARAQILACASLRLSWSATRPVRANRARLEQVFLNLLVNACEAIEPGHPQGNTISVAARDDGDAVEVVVADTGVGILPSELDRIFDLFYTTKAVGAGTGLGLSICHDLVEALGGRIHVTSEVGRGTELRVRLPAANAEVRPSAERSEPDVWQLARRILVVDDDPLVARSVRRLLGGGPQVTLVHEGPSALEELRAKRYDLVLCDVDMPGMDGVSLLEAVRAERPAAARRFVFMTGRLFDCESRQRMYAQRAPCVDKPLDITALTRALAQVLAAADAGTAGPSSEAALRVENAPSAPSGTPPSRPHPG